MLRITLFLCCITSLAAGQSVGIGTNNPDPNAALEIRSLTKGFLPPRLSETAINAMQNVTEGMVVFNTTLNCLMMYSNNRWDCLSAGAAVTNPFQVVASSYFSGADSSTVSEITDMETRNGFYYTAGFFSGTKLRLGNGVELTASALLTGATHGFIAKYDSSGNCQWAVKLIGASASASVLPRAIAVNEAGSVFVTGTFNDSMYLFNPNGTLFNKLSNDVSGDYDIFMLKLHPSGSVAWRRREGNNGGTDEAVNITLNGNDVFICGKFHGSQTLGNNLQRVITAAGGLDGFYAQYDTVDGTSCYNAQRIGGTGDDSINDIQLNLIGTEAYITGAFENTINIPVLGLAPLNITSQGSTDIFTGKLMLGFPVMDWVLYCRGTGAESGQKIVLNGPHLYLAGQFSSNSLSYRLDHPSATGLPFSQNAKGSSDVLLMRIDESTGEFLPFAGANSSWVTSYGGTAADAIRSLEINGDYCFVSGEFSRTMSFENGYPLYSAGGTDGYAAVFNKKTSDLFKVTWAGSPYADKCNAIVSRNNGDFAIAGACSQTVLYNGTSSGKPNADIRQAFLWVLK